MLGDLLLLLINQFLETMHSVLAVITIPVPPEISSTFTTFFSYIHLFDGIFPVGTAMLAIGFVFVIFLAVYGVKILLFAYALLPFAGKQVFLPTMESVNDSTLYGTEGNVMSTRHSTTHTRRKR